MGEHVVTLFFGTRWDSGVLDGMIEQRPVPVGMRCSWCKEAFVASDRGLFRNHILKAGRGYQAKLVPIHAECDLRMGMGSVAHLANLCSCHGIAEAPYEGTLRQEALEVLAVLDRMRAEHDLPPMFETVPP